MNLSAEQKQALQEGYARGLARSAALRHERVALLRRLDVQMLSGHPGTMERVNQVWRQARVGIKVRVRVWLRVSAKVQAPSSRSAMRRRCPCHSSETAHHDRSWPKP